MADIPPDASGNRVRINLTLRPCELFSADLAAFVPGYSGGSVPDVRGVPYPEQPLAYGK